ncbi:MAG: ABC transporter ATP-binding protein [Planctomycetes bacterium]|nr:ABC transporter ATP-binding protein [Planctomycetota bacterium]
MSEQSDSAALMELEGVGKVYAPPAGGAPVSVLRGIDLRIAAGESVAIVGPSGSGKSTLLNILGTLDRPSEGRVRLNGEDLAALDDEQLARIRSRRIGFIFQAHHLLPQCSVLENVLLPTLVPGLSASGAEARAKELLGKVGLSERIGHRPGELSGGECQRVAVVRALINQPAAVLADEPTGALDGEHADRLADLLVELNRDLGVTLVAVTHAPALAARMGRVLELRGGQLRPVDRTS